MQPDSELPKAIHIVYAKWCPHCVPTTVSPIAEAAAELGIPCKLYDIDSESVADADAMVKAHGDWCEDYLIPQVFFELRDGTLKHIMTGYPEGVSYTQRAVANILKSLLHRTAG